MDNQDVTRNQKARLALGAVFLFWGIWTAFWIYTDVILSAKRNLLYFGTTICLAFLIYLLAFNMLRRVKTIGDSSIRENILAFGFFVGFGLGIIHVFVHPYIAGSLSKYYAGGQHEVIFRIVADAFFVILTGGLYYLSAKRKEETKSQKPWWVILYVISAVHAGWYIYMPNCFEMDIWHFDAYFHSVKRALDLAPYTAGQTGVYGFYGILIAPIVRLLGGSVVDCILLLAVLTGIFVLCLCYVMDNMVKRVSFKLLGTVGISTFLIWGRQGGYYQIFPHRIFFISVMLAYIVWTVKHKRTNAIWKILGMLLSVLAIVWNIETGIACLAAWVGSDVINRLQRDSWKSKESLLAFGEDILQAFAALVLAYVLINFYNISVGGEILTVRECLFPLIGTRNGYMDFLMINLPKGITSWMFCLGILLGCMGFVISRTSLCDYTKKNDRMIYLTACTIAIMVQMTYYVNRAVDICLWIILPVFSIIIVYLSEYLFNSSIWKNFALGNGALRAFGTWTLSTLVGLAILFFIKYIPMYQEQSITRDMDSLQAFVQEVEEKIPEGTLGFGVGVDQVYSCLGWGTGYYGIDLPDIGVAINGSETCYNLLMESDAVFVNDEDLNGVFYQIGDDGSEWFATHDILAVIMCGKYEYRYYVRKY